MKRRAEVSRGAPPALPVLYEKLLHLALSQEVDSDLYLSTRSSRPFQTPENGTLGSGNRRSNRRRSPPERRRPRQPPPARAPNLPPPGQGGTPAVPHRAASLRECC